MAKYVVRVREVLRPDIHSIGHIESAEVVRGNVLPLPDRIEIQPDDTGTACMMYRYTKAGDFCGDTWHEDLESALEQAKCEYGLMREDFLLVQDGGVQP